MKFTWTNRRVAPFALALWALLALAPLSQTRATQHPILIAFDQSRKGAELAAKILTTRWHIPRLLIELKHTRSPCEIDHSRVIHLCFKKSGEMALAKYDKEIVDESFRIFFR